MSVQAIVTGPPEQVVVTLPDQPSAITVTIPNGFSKDVIVSPTLPYFASPGIWIQTGLGTNSDEWRLWLVEPPQFE